MKKLLLSGVLLTALFAASVPVQAASTYTVIDSSFQISGRLDLSPPPDSYHNAYTENSSTPLIGNIDFGSKYIQSQASFEGVLVAGNDGPSYSGSAQAFASTEVFFKPNFSGGTTPITFTFYRVGFVHYPVASIKDLTTGETIFSNSSYNGDDAFSYSEWDSDHLYRLYMQASLDFVTNDDGMLTVHDDMSFVFVPEPATMLLIGLGLVGLVGIRKRLRN